MRGIGDQAVAQRLLDGLPLQVLHHQHERAALVGAQVVDGDDVVAADSPRGAGLATEALDVAGVAGDLRVKDLQRDEPLGLLVSGEVDGLIPPRPMTFWMV